MYAAIAAVISAVAAQEAIYNPKPMQFDQSQVQAILAQQQHLAANQPPQQPIVLDVEPVEDEPAPTGLDALMALLKKNQETASSV